MPPEPAAPTPGDRRRVEHLLKSARDAVEILGELGSEEIARDMVRSRAIVNCYTEIGEAASRLSPAGRAFVGELPWRQIVAMRNLVVHVYWGIDFREVVKTTRSDLPGLITALTSALDRWPAESQG